MNIVGSNIVPFPAEMVWDAILDPRVLVATIPGCEQLVASGDHAYEMTVTAGVAAIKGTYQGSCALSDLKDNESLVMRLTGAGAPGTIDATVQVFFAESEPGVTRIDYEADAVVGGMVGGVGQRMLTSVSKRMAGEFFDNVARAIAAPAGAPVEAAAAGAPAAGSAQAVFTAPAKQAGSGDGFVKGLVVGAALVLLGVLVGWVIGGR